ncbi:energy-coupling factor transporter transmembrane component T family protein [Sporolactobacillus terrae]|uniref:Energy-coupling factor transporter transmembrane protein EcfT n=1 Tax=Sporolactobacillus terrae TaxID=269673 RepID=A0A5K7X362_9BACL|nr:energy-coupling factor transporter transmembrane component T [Sporolactobacillus terrae]BBN98326.1 energy-coupling factor transporter transmembrane protein EcfT [Sporolactobacillus terrae]
MTRDLTVGQFIPGHSLMHRLDPRTKLMLTFLFIIQVFLTKSALSLLFLLLLLWIYIVCAQVPAQKVFRAVRPIIPVIIVTALLNIFYVSGHVLWHYAFLRITDQGLFTGFTLLVRLITLIAGCSLITYTTSLNALASGLEQLLAPLKRLHFPVNELSMTLSITLRFLPTLAEELDRIIEAQKARGAQFGTGTILNRIRAFFPVILPLFMSAFRRAFELTNAIECRCYHGGEGRTKLHPLKLRRLDYAAVIFFLAAFAMTLIFNGIRQPF